MWFLNMQSLKAAQTDAIAWTDVGPTPYGSNYDPVMALANNHIHFLDVPNVPAGSADIFVIHCGFILPKGLARATYYAFPISLILPASASGIPSVKWNNPSHPWSSHVILPAKSCSSNCMLLVITLTNWRFAGSTRIRVHPR
jgi:hypothetical protein